VAVRVTRVPVATEVALIAATTEGAVVVFAGEVVLELGLLGEEQLTSTNMVASATNSFSGLFFLPKMISCCIFHSCENDETARLVTEVARGFCPAIPSKTRNNAHTICELLVT